MHPLTTFRNNTIRGGFTLIELLVVIAIIGLLSSVVLASLASARVKARDATRFSDIKQLQTAVELYYSAHGYYPKLSAYTTSAAGGCGASWCTLETQLAAFLPKLPRDPLGNRDDYRYYYKSNAGDNYQTYGVMVRFESSGNAALMANDKGYYSWLYERGQRPSYCTLKYGASDNWWGASGTVCQGGN
jgi:prepilin-type N-terminal cleavage/methylation domain-containing protein